MSSKFTKKWESRQTAGIASTDKKDVSRIPRLGDSVITSQEERLRFEKTLWKCYEQAKHKNNLQTKRPKRLPDAMSINSDMIDSKTNLVLDRPLLHMALSNVPNLRESYNPNALLSSYYCNGKKPGKKLNCEIVPLVGCLGKRTSVRKPKIKPKVLICCPQPIDKEHHMRYEQQVDVDVLYNSLKQFFVPISKNDSLQNLYNKCCTPLDKRTNLQDSYGGLGSKKNQRSTTDLQKNRDRDFSQKKTGTYGKPGLYGNKTGNEKDKSQQEILKTDDNEKDKTGADGDGSKKKNIEDGKTSQDKINQKKENKGDDEEDKKDKKDIDDARDKKDKKGKEDKEGKDAKEAKGGKEGKEGKDGKEGKEAKEGKEGNEAKEDKKGKKDKNNKGKKNQSKGEGEIGEQSDKKKKKISSQNSKDDSKDEGHTGKTSTNEKGKIKKDKMDESSEHVPSLIRDISWKLKHVPSKIINSENNLNNLDNLDDGDKRADISDLNEQQDLTSGQGDEKSGKIKTELNLTKGDTSQDVVPSTNQITKVSKKKKIRKAIIHEDEIKNPCQCPICEFMQRRKLEPDTPLIKNMKIEQEKMNLKIYLRQLRQKECQQHPTLRAVQHKVEPIVCDNSFCADRSIAECAKCVKALECLQDMLEERENQIQNCCFWLDLKKIRHLLCCEC